MRGYYVSLEFSYKYSYTKKIVIVTIPSLKSNEIPCTIIRSISYERKMEEKKTKKKKHRKKRNKFARARMRKLLMELNVINLKNMFVKV